MLLILLSSIAAAKLMSWLSHKFWGTFTSLACKDWNFKKMRVNKTKHPKP